jgi:hypothetical protein
MSAGMIDTFMWDKGTPQQRMATPLETVQILDEIDRCTVDLNGCSPYTLRFCFDHH